PRTSYMSTMRRLRRYGVLGVAFSLGKEKASPKPPQKETNIEARFCERPFSFEKEKGLSRSS
ncbi:MAG: hypothetical protein IJC54_08220, partial [Clostridia bacterium]|nr:hypothetical protein [Clostridia bacterium]MBQ4086536.1 hypothetical protein [Clostridia bacterium]